MNFAQAIRICYQKFADFKGRASRSEFWYFYLFVFLVNIIAVVLALQITSIFVVWIIFTLISFVPALAVTARRLHDIGRTGWWQILAYIPYVGIIASIVLIVFWCTEGEKKKNIYGKPLKIKR